MIREAEHKDCQMIAEIYNEYLGTSTMDLEEKSGSYFSKVIDNQSVMEKLYVIDVENDVIGWGIIKKYSDREGYAKTGETSVYLHKDFIRKGYGSLMKRHLLDQAKELGYKHLVAKIWAENEISIKYNYDFGYTMVGTQHKVGYVNGKWVDAVIMQYVFD